MTELDFYGHDVPENPAFVNAKAILRGHSWTPSEAAILHAMIDDGEQAIPEEAEIEIEIE